MPRASTGSVTYQQANSTTPAHWKARLTLPGGKRVWEHFEHLTKNTPDHEAQARKLAVEMSKLIRERGLAAPAPTPAQPQGETVKQYAQRWMADRQRRGISRPEADDSRWRTHLEPVFGDMLIADVTDEA